MKASTFVIVSADHGGGGDVVTDAQHATPTAPVNPTIPFFVTGPGVTAGSDLYALNPARRELPAADQNPSILIAETNGRQVPIRNGDGGNLALDLLGLEPIATSTINARQDLNVFDVRMRFGSSLADQLIGGAGRDGLEGEGGADAIQGLAGDDVLDGGLGNDMLYGGVGDDRLNGGAGGDFANYAGTRSGVQVDLRIDGAQDTRGAGLDTLVAVENLSGSIHMDVLQGDAANNQLRGSAGDDRLFGHDGTDILNGGTDADWLEGGAGNDLLVGSTGRDRLFGGDGRDLIVGGADRDLLTGGAGADRFRFFRDDSAAGGAADVIADFNQGERDRIDLAVFDADGLTPRIDAFTFIGGQTFSGARGELRAEAFEGFTMVEGDLNADRQADFAIRLDGEFVLTERDFLFAPPEMPSPAAVI